MASLSHYVVEESPVLDTVLTQIQRLIPDALPEGWTGGRLLKTPGGFEIVATDYTGEIHTFPVLIDQSGIRETSASISFIIKAITTTLSRIPPLDALDILRIAQ